MDPRIADLRKSYERAELDEQAAHADPLRQFETWLQQAIDGQVPEPNAMTLATVGADGRPSTRVVLVKGVDARGIAWYTNFNSRKGQELAVHGWIYGLRDGLLRDLGVTVSALDQVPDVYRSSQEIATQYHPQLPGKD